MMATYSIVIPLYNSANTIARCLEILVCQEGIQKEIILIDDGSIDATPQILDEYARKYSSIKVIHQKNRGASAARNRGIEEASGEWISFVDADDIVTEDYIAAFDAVKDKADVNYFSSRIVTDGYIGEHLLQDCYYEGNASLEDALIALKLSEDKYEHYGYTWNKFFRASIIRKHNIRFIEGLRYREDEIFTNDFMCHAHSVRTMSYIGYNYLYTLNGLSGRSISRDMYGVYYHKAEEFLATLNDERLQLHELQYILPAGYNTFELETSPSKYLHSLRNLLGIVKKYDKVMPRANGNDYYSSIINYYKEYRARKKIDILMFKKYVRSLISKLNAYCFFIF